MKYLSEIDGSKAGRLIVPTYANKAAFPSASTSKGSLAYDDALDDLYHSDGSNWVLLTKEKTFSLTAGGTDEIAVPAGRLISQIVVTAASGSGSVSIGITGLGSEVIENESYNTSGRPFTIGWWFPSDSTLFFSVFTGTITVKVFYA
jgi:hypothetical protein